MESLFKKLKMSIRENKVSFTVIQNKNKKACWSRLDNLQVTEIRMTKFNPPDEKTDPVKRIVPF